MNLKTPLSPKSIEANFDGLIGPTHNYSGLSYGNIASTSHRAHISRPKEAALQGLEKMKYLSDLGLVQGIIPPQERPHIPTLKAFGFSGSDQAIIQKVYKQDPVLLSLVTSASCMWTANAATVAPSFDTENGKVHFTVANLNSNPHRAIEPPMTAHILANIFSDPHHC